MTAAPQGVRVRVPATSANLGPGYDAFGLALGLHDVVEVRLHPDRPGRRTAEVTGTGAGTLPRDGTHLVLRSFDTAWAAFATSGEDAVPPAVGVSARCRNAIPQGRGLGSSAAATVAGVLAAAALRERAGDRAAVLDVAARIEGHPDNVAACVLGGLTVAWYDGGAARAVRLDPAADLDPAVLVPDGELATTAARAMLPDTVPHADAAHGAGRAGLLVAVLTGLAGDGGPLLAATEDRLHQPYRAAAAPETAQLLRRLRAEGAAAVVSGAGPAVLVLRRGAAGDAIPAAAGWTAYRPGLDRDGAAAVVLA